MARVMVSACLMGQPVRYDGRSKSGAALALARLQAEHELVPFCPEVAAGLPTPRPAAEIQAGLGADVLAGKARIIGCDQVDVTAAFIEGAYRALAQCQALGIRHAVLTEASPSCGSQRIYDGTFQGQTRSGQGVTTALLSQAGIQVFNPQQIDYLLSVLVA